MAEYIILGCNGHKPFYTARWQKTGKLGSTPAEIVEHMHKSGNASHVCRIIQYPTHPSLAPIQLLSAIEELQCPICFGVLQQRIQLLCDRFVFATCLIQWVHLAAAHYPCCYTTLPLECAHIKPASKMVQLLLHDVMVLYDSTVLTQDDIQHLVKHLIVIMNSNCECHKAKPSKTSSVHLNRRTELLLSSSFEQKNLEDTDT